MRTLSPNTKLPLNGPGALQPGSVVAKRITCIFANQVNVQESRLPATVPQTACVHVRFNDEKRPSTSVGSVASRQALVGRMRRRSRSSPPTATELAEEAEVVSLFHTL